MDIGVCSAQVQLSKAGDRRRNLPIAAIIRSWGKVTYCLERELFDLVNTAILSIAPYGRILNHEPSRE